MQVGSNCKIQNGAFLYHGCTLEDGVFVGPGVIFTNDKRPRAINPDGSLKGADDWEVGRTVVRHGASVGTGSIVLPGVTIGRFAMVAAGAVVSKDVPDYGLAVGRARAAGRLRLRLRREAARRPRRRRGGRLRALRARYRIAEARTALECRAL